ncbi:hypothetical protein AUK10_04310 [Candidatus Gracilibacteria bacterium CG2_30_37_12]|nr:MAG: hypothetical protein AUK10_04310 [Candidatus Gracilibacteria bacterium CG2_30_37_12]
MLSIRFKTSTRTAIMFTLFASVLLLVFVMILNIYYFYNWRLDERNEVIDKTEHLAVFSIKTQSGTNVSIADIMSPFYNRIMAEGGMLQTTEGASLISPKWNTNKPNILGLYKSGDKWYMQYTFPFRNIGTVGLSYDVTEHVDVQFTLLRISLLLSLVFFLIITLISFLFTKASLKPLEKIIGYIRSFQAEFPLPEFPLTGPKNDEFVIVAATLSEAFKKIQSQTEVLRQFSIDAAHEFKTPLMIIHSEIDCALKSGDYQTGFDNIRSQIYFLDTMIGTLLTIARIEKEDIKKEKINVSELFEDNINEIEKIFHEKGLHVIRNIDKNIVFNTNRSLFQMIVSNLIKNAFNYTNNGEIEITLNKKGFSVRDTGIGIVKENLDKIWDRLYRVDSSWSVQNGHGLGLFLVKTIVEKLGYVIHVESELGKGSTFSVKF